jgi:hypothetical protein
MSELTKEYLDKAISNLATKADVRDEVRSVVEASEKRIVKRIDETEEELARIIADTVAVPFTQRFDRLEKLLQVEQDVETLKRQMTELRSALHLSA